MPLIHRRIFYAKAGAAGQLVQLMQDGNAAMGRYGSSIDSRILTDHMTGRSDRQGNRVLMQLERFPSGRGSGPSADNRHSRAGGNPGDVSAQKRTGRRRLSFWVPAFAGTTNGTPSS